MKIGIAATLVIPAAVALVVATGASATATVEHPGGGTWDYGVIEPASTIFVYSDYHHPSSLHRSSVRTTQGITYRSSDKPGGSWSHVDHSTSWSGNQAFWYVY